MDYVRVKEEDQEPVMPEEITKPFEFLKLPAEVRNIIYKSVLVKKRYFSLFFQPPLTLVNKQIRSESLPVLYGNNKFIVYLEAGALVHKRERLQGLWSVPSPVLSVSAMSNFRYIAKLDIRFSFVTEWWFRGPKPRGLDLYVYMRRCGSSEDESMSDGKVHQHGSRWTDPPTFHAIYDIFAEDEMGQPEDGGEKRLAVEGRTSVRNSLFYFTEICPAVGEGVWMHFRKKRSRS